MGLVSFMLYFALFSASVDFEYSMSKLANMIIGLVVIVGPVLLLHPRAVLWGRPAGQPRRVEYREGLG